jgi:hypothetical protein
MGCPAQHPRCGGSDCRRYDIPVVVALAASPKIYAIGMGRLVGDIGADWLHAIDHPIPPNPCSLSFCMIEDRLCDRNHGSGFSGSDHFVANRLR